jgi:predicted metal-dependent phosphoesterase TrpH
VDAIEVLNSRCLFESANQKAREFTKKNGLAGSAGSDSHSPWEIGNAFVEADATDLEEFQKQIRKGKIEAKGNRSNQFVHFFSTIAKFLPHPK